MSDVNPGKWNPTSIDKRVRHDGKEAKPRRIVLADPSTGVPRIVDVNQLPPKSLKEIATDITDKLRRSVGRVQIPDDVEGQILGLRMLDRYAGALIDLRKSLDEKTADELATAIRRKVQLVTDSTTAIATEEDLTVTVLASGIISKLERLEAPIDLSTLTLEELEALKQRGA
jgi:hypothetical protein